MKLTDLFTLAAALADRGIVRAEQLRAAGADPDSVAQAVARHWQAPVLGIYVLHRDPLTDVELAHVGRRHGGPGSLVSGVLAARAYGMRWIPDVPGVVVLVSHDVRRQDSSGTVTVRRSLRLREITAVLWEGVLLAAKPRVVVDACRQVITHRTAEWGQAREERRTAFEKRCLQEVRGIVLAAVADGHATPAGIRQVLAAGSRRHTRLIARACTDAERGVASPPEAECADDLFACNVPFACNVELWDGDELVAVLDVVLLGTGVGSEMDSKAHHGTEITLDGTLRRHGRVEAYGGKLLHVTPTRYRGNPHAHLRDLFAEVRRRQARGLGDPPGLRMVLRGPVLCGPGKDRPYPVPEWALEAARTGVLPEYLTRTA